MFGTRIQTPYAKFEAPAPEPSHQHRTFKPERESLDEVRFDLRMPGNKSHMSTTMFLERKFTVQIQQVDLMREQYVLAADADHTRVYRPMNLGKTKSRFMISSPGLSLQNNASNIYFNFNGGSVAVDTEWLPVYASLYKKALTPFVRGSGRSFSNHNDYVLRSNELNVPDYNVGLITCNPERNDRRVRHDFTPGVGGLVHYFNYAWDVPVNVFAQDFTTTIRNSIMFQNLYTPLDYTQNPGNHVLQSNVTLTSDVFRDYYLAHWEADDLALGVQFMAAIDRSLKPASTRARKSTRGRATKAAPRVASDAAHDIAPRAAKPRARRPARKKAEAK